jgi:hypothetical protein
MKFLAIKDFEKFQHYRDRNPPWIKLYATILTDAYFLQLPEAAQAQLMKLWVLASQMGNPLPFSPRLLAGKIGAGRRCYLDLLVSSGFLIPRSDLAEGDASIVLAECSKIASTPVCARKERAETELDATTSCLARTIANRSNGKHRESDAVPTAPVPSESVAVDGRTPVALVSAANRGIAEHWGEQTSPLRHDAETTHRAIEQLACKGVPTAFASDVIYSWCCTSKNDRPPRSMNYFVPIVLEQWGAAQEREHASAATPRLRMLASSRAKNGRPPTVARPPEKYPEATKPGGTKWQD